MSAPLTEAVDGCFFEFVVASGRWSTLNGAPATPEQCQTRLKRA
jgi:hypothetical protein